MNFKKSAFEMKTDIKIRCLEYEGKFHLSDSILDSLSLYILSLCSLTSSKITIHEFNIYKFKYAIKKHGFDPEDENHWKFVRDDIR